MKGKSSQQTRTMPIRISLCANAGSNRGKVVSSFVLKDGATIAEIERIARNKLKIPKKKQVILYEHQHGTRITAENLTVIVVNGTVLNVSCGESFISPQGMTFASSSSSNGTKSNVLPKPPRWPAPFGTQASLELDDAAHAQSPLDHNVVCASQERSIIYIDLDGVLANFDEGVRELCGNSPNQVPPSTLWQMISAADNFFVSLGWMDKGQQLFNTVIETFGGEWQIEILTACPKKFQAQKRQWCLNKLGPDITVHVCNRSKDKPKWSHDSCILIDDSLDLKGPWEARGGTFIHHQNLKETLSALSTVVANHPFQDRIVKSSDSRVGVSAWPDRFVQFVSLELLETNLETLLMDEELPDRLRAKIISTNRSTPLHLTLAHCHQISQKCMRERFGGIEGEIVELDVVGVLWSENVAALDVRVANQSSMGVVIPPPVNSFVHVTIWHDNGVQPVKANDLPRHVAEGLADEIQFIKAKRVLARVSYKHGIVAPPPTTSPIVQPLNFHRKSLFADLSGDVLNCFKVISRSNKYLTLKHHDEHISVDYTDLAAFHRDSSNDGLYLQECRGLLLSPDNGAVVARRFHKFYNVHEVSSASDICVRGGVLMEKLDGFLVSPFVSPKDNEIRWATRQERSSDVEDLIDSFVCSDYTGFVRHWMGHGYTPLFECILQKQHNGLVSYNCDRVVLLAIRHMETGIYVPWADSVISAAKHNIPVARTIRKVGADETLDDILRFVRNDLAIVEEMEGVVLVLADGQHRYKIKTNWYLNRAKLQHTSTQRSAKSSRPEIFSWEKLSSSHWSGVPNHLVWEVALWEWLSEGTIDDDVLPSHVERLHETACFPVNVLLYFIDTVRRNVVCLDNELVAWAMDNHVLRNRGEALRLAEKAGWDLSLIDAYLSDSSECNTLRGLATFLWHKIIRKGKWNSLRKLLNQTFVSISELCTDTQRILPLVLPIGELEAITIILRGLPSSGKSYFANHILVPYLAPIIDTENIAIFSADDFFVQENGVYLFDESLLSLAHADCRKRFVDSAAVIKIVDNTNSTLQEYMFYKRKSSKVCVFEIHAHGHTKQNSHNVPVWKVNRMRHRWETDPDAIHIQMFHS
jgi:hypothetical protein